MSTSSSSPHDEGDPVNREAIEATAAVWLSLRDRGMSPSETEAFIEWLQSDLLHKAAYESLEKAWDEFDRLAEIVKPGTPANADALAPRYHRRFAKLPLISLGTAAALAVLCFSLWKGATSRHFAETAVGAFQKLDLPDGSVALLNTDTAIDVDMSGVERRVQLVRGEVHFDVRHDVAHPFIVTVGDVRVRDIGTAFGVRARTSSVEVLVTEGRVELEDRSSRSAPVNTNSHSDLTTLLSAGEKAVVPEAAGKRRPAPIHISRLSAEEYHRALAWQERRLEFDEIPLAEVAAEFNRYNRTQLVVNDTQLAARPFTGTFRPDGYETFVTLLHDNFGVEVVRDRNEIHLRRR